MTLGESSITESPPASPWLVVARHAVLIVGVLAVYAAVAIRVDSFFVVWVVSAFMVFGLATVIAGLSLLFFTSAEKGKSLITLRNAAWVLTGFMFLDPLFQVLHVPSQSLSKLQPRIEQPAPTGLPAQTEPGADQERPNATDSESAKLTNEPITNGKSASVPTQKAPQPEFVPRDITKRRPHADVAEEVAKPVAVAQCHERPGTNAKTRRALLAKIRRDYPTLADSDDAAVVRATHAAFYEDLPLQCIANALGVVMP